MRKLTQEQIEKTKAKREACRKLVHEIASMTDEQKQAIQVKMAGVITCEGHCLSARNSILVYFQAGNMPITIVGGFHQWRKQGRKVKKGEHGFSIWIPILPAKHESELVDEENGKIKFFIGTIFDVSQTEETAGENKAEGIEYVEPEGNLSEGVA